MANRLFTTDVLLDISVNVIPLLIMAAFLVLFLAVAPWGRALSLPVALQLALLVAPIVGLAILTYEAAKRIESGEGEAT